MTQTLAGIILGLVLAFGPALARQDQPAVTGQIGEDIQRKAEESAVLILVGSGGGHVESVNVGMIVRSDGFILAAYHPFRSALEVQVRLSNGEIYDHVDLVDFDERRDVAALHIPALGLPALTLAAPGETAPGEKICLLTNHAGTAWSFSVGVLGSMRLADEMAGAGQGFRVLQFQVPAALEANGGALFNTQGHLLGILTSSSESTGSTWAVPADTAMGLTTQVKRTPFGTGKDLEIPKATAHDTGTPHGKSNPYMVLTKAHTLQISSRTASFKANMLEKELVNCPEFRELGLNVVKASHHPDLTVDVDRPLLTFDFTYSLADGHTGTIVASGKVTAIDGPHAARGIAKKIMLEFEKARTVRTIETGTQ